MSYGIDSGIQARVDAYRGQPERLQQKYQMSKDLIDLLALQKLKTDKESAAREMQLEMAAQQGQPATVAQQREGEMLESNKQELMQQHGALMQQQNQQRQQNLQRAAQGPAPQQMAQAGLPNLPAPNVATPKAMAAGGIVAFDNGGGVDASGTDTSYTPSGSGLGVLDPRQYLRSASPEETQRMNALLEKYRGKISAQQARAISEGRMSEEDFLRSMTPKAPVIPTAEPAPDSGRVAPPDRGRVAPPPPAPGGAPAVPAGGGINSLLGSALKESLSPESRAKAAETERTTAAQYLMPTQEETARRQQMLADMQARNKELYDPERLRDESLTRGLLGAAGRSTIGQTLAGAGLGSLNYDIKMRELARQRLGEEQAQEEAMMGKQAAGRKDVYGAGQAKEKNLSEEFRTGMTSATHLRAAELQAAASRETAAAMRDANNFNRLSATLASVQDKRREAYNDVLTRYPVYAALSQKNPADLSKSEKAQLDEQKKLINQDMKINVAGFDEQIGMLRQALMRGGNMPASPSAGQWGQPKVVDQPKT